MKVLFLTNIPSPYRVDFFNNLGKLCDLTVIFEKSTSSERDHSWIKQDFKFFKGIVLNGISISADKAINLNILNYLKKNKYDYIIVSNALTPTGMLAIQLMKIKRIPYIIEGDGGFPKNGKGIKENIKKHFISGALAYFSTAKMHDLYYLMYGAKIENIHRYPFTTLKTDDIISTPLSIERKLEIKKKLSMEESKIIISVGQYIHRKGFDILIKACKYVDNNIGVYIIGGTVNKEYIDLVRNLNLDNVHFVGFKLKDELAEYYKAADVFVLPTREDIWGLVINEAMAYGLPIVTTDKCIAGLELVKNNENGILISKDDVSQLAQAINRIISDNNILNKMSYRSIEMIKEYTIENMANRHIEVLRELKNDAINI